MEQEQSAATELLRIAKNVIWFEAPEQALRDPNRFLAYLMTYGSIEDVAVASRHFSDESFEAALRYAPPGIFDIRSWTYWHLYYSHDPVPPLPERHIP
jgi:hypothetical protein